MKNWIEYFLCMCTWCAWLYLVLCVGASVHASACVFMSMCVKTRSQSWLYFSSTLNFSFWHRVPQSTWSSLILQDYNQQALGLLLPLLPQWWDYRLLSLSLDFMCMLGIWTRVFMLTWDALYQLSHPSRSPYGNFYGQLTINRTSSSSSFSMCSHTDGYIVEIAPLLASWNSAFCTDQSYFILNHILCLWLFPAIRTYLLCSQSHFSAKQQLNMLASLTAQFDN